MNTYRKFAGIDVSKAKLDVYITNINEHKIFGNDCKGIKELISFLKDNGVDYVAFEATGGYEKNAAVTLIENQITTYIIQPKRIRDYAKAIGRFAKTDRIDAALIALYLSSQYQHLMPFTHNASITLLRKYLDRRAQLVEMHKVQKLYN